MQYNAMQYNAMPYNAMLRHAAFPTKQKKDWGAFLYKRSRSSEDGVVAG